MTRYPDVMALERSRVAAALLAGALGCSGAATDGATPRVETVVTHTPSAPPSARDHAARCDAGDLVACHAAALDAYYAPSSPESDARALALFRKACDGGYAPSCNGVGVLQREGRGVPRDEAAAARMFRAACEKDASTACDHLADALERGAGVTRDPEAAARARARGRCVFEASSLHQGDLARCPGL